MITLCEFMQELKSHTDQSTHTLASRLWDEYCKANGIYFRDLVESSMAKRMFWIGYSIKQKMNEHQVKISTEIVRDKSSLYKDENGLPRGLDGKA